METTQPATRTAREQFDRQANHYDAQWNSWSEETLTRLLEMAQPQFADTVLDVATGSGFTALEFAPHVAKVIGIDVSTGMLDAARRNAGERGCANLTFIEAAAEALPLDDSSVDIVTCRIAAHHFLSVEQFTRQVARVLRPGGRFALVDTTVPDGDPETGAWQNAVEAIRDPSHVRNLSPSEWTAIVGAAGLDVQMATDAGAGITIPLTDWLTKSGCKGDDAHEVRRRFERAPNAARAAFQIHRRDDGETVFTWRRVLLAAVKSIGPRARRDPSLGD